MAMGTSFVLFSAGPQHLDQCLLVCGRHSVNIVEWTNRVTSSDLYIKVASLGAWFLSFKIINEIVNMEIIFSKYTY